MKRMSDKKLAEIIVSCVAGERGWQKALMGIAERLHGDRIPDCPEPIPPPEPKQRAECQHDWDPTYTDVRQCKLCGRVERRSSENWTLLFSPLFGPPPEKAACEHRWEKGALYCPGLDLDQTIWVRRCSQCDTVQLTKHKGFYEGSPPVGSVWTTILPVHKPRDSHTHVWERKDIGDVALKYCKVCGRVEQWRCGGWSAFIEGV